MGLWLLMSGIYETTIIGYGVGSVLLVVFVMARMDHIDQGEFDWRFRPFVLLGYFAWLMVEIGKANWAVTKIILSPKARLRQHVFTVPVSQKTALGQATFANSITLTPGTITIETEDDHFLVHAASYSPEDHDAIADMDRRVSACETGAA